MPTDTYHHNRTATIVTAIRTGEFDDRLDAIIAAATERRAELNPSDVSSLKVGDHVEFNSKVRPKYMIGLKAIVVKVNGKSACVDCGPDAGRFANKKGVRAPLTLLKRSV